MSSEATSTLPPFDCRPLLLADLDPVLELLSRELGAERLWLVARPDDFEAFGLGALETLEIRPGSTVLAAGPAAEALRRAGLAHASPRWTPEGGLSVRIGDGGLVTGPTLRRTPEVAALAGTLTEVACGIVGRAADLARAQARIRELAELSTVDPLTGLRNRRYLDRKFTSELLRRRRYQRALALMLLDLDHFKQLNDSHGHDVGDAVLQEVARVLKEALRVTDVAVRIGGEEFAALLPETPIEGAVLVAERIRRTIAAREVNGARVTVSVGVAAVEGRWEGDAAALMRAADQALYRAKRLGRDRVEHAHLGEGSVEPPT